MLNPHPFAFASLFTTLASFWVAANFLIYGKKDIHRLWAYFNLAIFGWSFLVTLATMTANPQEAYKLWNYSHGFGVFISIFFFHFCSRFTNFDSKNIIKISYCYGGIGILIIFPFNGYPIHTGVNYLFNSMYYLEADKIYFPLIISPWFLLAFCGVYKIYKFYKNNPNKEERQRTMFFLAIIIIAYLGGASTFLPMLGFNNFYPITIMGIGLYCIISTYAMFRDQFLELRVIYQKSLVYSFLIAVITLTYLVMVLLLEKATRELFGYSSSNLSILTAFIVGVIATPAHRYLQDFVDIKLFKGKPAEIAEENASLRQALTHTEKLKAVATLASGLAHEIRNPLTTILTFAEHLPNKKDDPEFLNKCQKTLVTETQRVNELLTQLLAFAKPSPPALQDVNLKNLIEEVLLLTDHQCSKNNICIEKSLISNQIIQADTSQLKQALLNIVLNAIDAMPNSGTLNITTFTNKSAHIISIKDNGSGIEPKDLKQIFDPFFSKKEKGTGLGLAITHGIIEQNKGRIIVKSEVGRGTEFLIMLPTRDKNA